MRSKAVLIAAILGLCFGVSGVNAKDKPKGLNPYPSTHSQEYVPLKKTEEDISKTLCRPFSVAIQMLHDGDFHPLVSFIPLNPVTRAPEKVGTEIWIGPNQSAVEMSVDIASIQNPDPKISDNAEICLLKYGSEVGVNRDTISVLVDHFKKQKPDI